MYRDRFTKIVATLGPASSSRERLRALFEAGADVFRLNFSHGTQDDHRQRVDLLRALEKEYKHPDRHPDGPAGPQAPAGHLRQGPLELKKGQKLRFDMDEAPGTAKRVPLPHRRDLQGSQARRPPADRRRQGAAAHRRARRDHHRHRGRGAGHDQRPQGRQPAQPRDPDVADDDQGPSRPDLRPVARRRLGGAVLRAARQRHRRAEEAGGRPRRRHGQAREAAAIDHLDEIIEQSDGIMVARGDLGVEMPPEAVPPLQKRILRGLPRRRTGRPSSPPRCSNRWSIRRRRRAPRPRTWRPRSMTAPTR